MQESSLPDIHLVVLAGGSSTRARRSDSTAPKQFRTVGETMLFMFSVQQMLQVTEVVTVTLAVPEPWRAVAESALTEADLNIQCLFAPAGSNRSGSTWNALDVLANKASGAPGATDLVAVHDAARPFATSHLLRRLAEAAAEHGGAVPGVAVPDTIVQIAKSPDHDRATVNYLERSLLQAVQTPQVFQWEPLYAAHQWCEQSGAAFTDDGGLLTARGYAPVVVMGEQENWKITTEMDWARAANLLK